MTSLYYPILPDHTGAESHRRGLISGFVPIERLKERNQLSRLHALFVIWDGLTGNRIYVRMNVRSKNFRFVLKTFWLLNIPYFIEINAPCQEDASDPSLYEKAIRRATGVFCVSRVLKRHITHLNTSIITVANGGRVFKPCAESVFIRGEKAYVLFVFDGQWAWQSAKNMIKIADKLKDFQMSLKVVDVSNTLMSGSDNLSSNITLLTSQIGIAYENLIQEASGFYIEYAQDQDTEIGFYGDSLKFRDFWNTSKPIIISGPLMHWAPNAQTPSNGIFEFDYFWSNPEASIFRCYSRIPYTWEHAGHRIHSKMNSYSRRR